MQIFLVGGAVRDRLLGHSVSDEDYVVVGATAADMLAHGYLPVGKDFPVFLHPESRCEYALARGPAQWNEDGQACPTFSPSITLEEDLSRRDLTINAMASTEEGVLVDPYGGKRDIERKLLRHVGESFAEDPIRVLRTARFMARYTDFSIAPETLSVMTDISRSGVLNKMAPARLWKEISRGLMEFQPSRMWESLKVCGALGVLMPELLRLSGVLQPLEHHPEGDAWIHTMMAVDYSARQNHALDVRFAVLTHDLGKGLTPPSRWPSHHGHEAAGVPLVADISKRLGVPNDCYRLASIVACYHLHGHTCKNLKASTLADLLTALGAYRRGDHLEKFIQACEADTRGRLGKNEAPYPQADYLRQALTVASNIDAAGIAQRSRPDLIVENIRVARIKAIESIGKQRARPKP